MKKLLFVCLLVFGLSSSVNAILIDRGGGLIYDDFLDITWLQDTNYSRTSGFDGDGRMTWLEAMAWVNDLTYAGIDGWRLPSALNMDGTGPCGPLPNNCTESEMGHLYYVDLENVSPPAPNAGLQNTGMFFNMEPFVYWTNTPHPFIPDTGWYFHFNNGEQAYSGSTYFIAWAVHDGDVAPIPEPATILLVGVGLAGIAGIRRKLKS